MDIMDNLNKLNKLVGTIPESRVKIKYIEVYPGWWPIMDEAISKIKAIAPDAKISYKEKYGTLRINVCGGDWKAIEAITDEAEKQSEVICEYCGQPGKLRTEREWISTMCDHCAGLNENDLTQIIEKTAAEYYRRNET